jgi:hypothetical protein
MPDATDDMQAGEPSAVGCPVRNARYRL